MDRINERSGSLQQAYEERFLVLLLLLRHPRLRMIYVTSMPIAPKIVEYYLALLTEVMPSHARARLSLISVEYAKMISADAQRIGERLAHEGVLGRFAVDFVVVRSGDGSWTSYATELNLRKGGTTHPFLILQFLTDGRYDPATALFLTPSSREKHLVATDHLESPMLRGLIMDDLFDIVARRGLHFDPARQEGVVFHMISCLTEFGRIGLTAVGDTPISAKAMYQKAERILLEEARESLAERPLPA